MPELLHSTTRHQLVALQQALPHAVLIHGNAGTGKEAIAEELVAYVAGNISKNNPNILRIIPDGGSIGIDQVRSIRNYLKRKTPGKNAVRRVIFISNSHLLTTEAQNALLKTLEEPPKDAIVILTADDPTKLKQTIRSRSQQLIVLPVALEDVQEFYNHQGFKQSDIVSAYYMSDGRAGLIDAVLNDSEKHELVRAISSAKQLLKQSAYKRLAQIDAMIKDKDNLATKLMGLERVVASGLRQAADKNNVDAVRKFYKISKLIEKTKVALSANANSKLMLTELFINL